MILLFEESTFTPLEICENELLVIVFPSELDKLTPNPANVAVLPEKLLPFIVLLSDLHENLDW